MDSSVPYPSLSVSSSLYVLSGSLDEEPDFVDLDDKYRCVECRRVLLRDPQQTMCGHRMHRPCVERLMAEAGEGVAGFPCPAGEEDCVLITRDEVNPDFSVLREISHQKVHCNYRTDGCPDIMKLRVLKAHLNDCRFKPIDCPYKDVGCEERVSAAVVEEHSRECRYRPATCPHCQRSIPTLRLLEHAESECAQNIVECPYKCGATVRRSQLEDHIKNCPSLCKYHSMGCREQGSPAHLAVHEVNDAIKHLDLVMVHLAKMKLDNAKVRAALERVTDDLEQMRARLMQQNQAMDTLHKNVEALAAQVKSSEQRYLQSLATQNEKLLALEDRIKAWESQARDIPTLRQRQAKIDESLQTLGTGAAATALPAVLHEQFSRQEITLSVHEKNLEDMNVRLQCIETTNYEGSLIWKIGEYRKRRREAMTGGNVSLYSQPFFSSRYGYKMCARAYLNGDGAGKGTHVSMFFVVMQGEYDDILPWPFRLKVTITLLDQRNHRKHLMDSFRPDPSSTSFQKPVSRMNVASGCPLFIQHNVLEASDIYLVDDAMYFKIAVDTTDYNTH